MAGGFEGPVGGPTWAPPAAKSPAVLELQDYIDEIQRCAPAELLYRRDRPIDGTVPAAARSLGSTRIPLPLHRARRRLRLVPSLLLRGRREVEGRGETALGRSRARSDPSLRGSARASRAGFGSRRGATPRRGQPRPVGAFRSGTGGSLEGRADGSRLLAERDRGGGRRRRG